MSHLRTLGILNVVYAAIVLLACLGAAALLAIPALSGEGMGLGLGELVILGAAVGLVLVLGVLYVVAASLVAKGRGRILQTVLAVMSLGSVPVGTAYGIYALWVCWMNEETKALFR